MPEPLLYLQAMGTAAIASAIVFALAMAGMRRLAGTTRLNTACVFGLGSGLLCGHYVLSRGWTWPPTNSLDRLMSIVIPAVLCVELIAGFRSVPSRIGWLLRISLAAATPRILLHGSVYLSRTGEWTTLQTVTTLAVSGALLAAVWSFLARLSRRSGGVSILLALCLALLCAGSTVMMAGYIKGGAATLPAVATLVAMFVLVRLILKPDIGRCVPAEFATPAILGIAVAELFGLLLIGRYFGRLSTACALAIFLAPLLCWVTELPRLRRRAAWVVGSVRLVLVAIPLVVVMVLAKRHFDREMAPLLGQVSTSMEQRPTAER